MEAWLLTNEPSVRGLSALTLFVVMVTWELVAPARALRVGRGLRWVWNVGLVVLNTLALRAVLPMAAVGFAALAEREGWGLFNQGWVPHEVAVVLSVVLLDLAIWTQHLVFHRVPWLWRLHRVHHADLDYDVTLGTRFHPIEIGLSMLIKLTLVGLLGTPAVSVLVFELVLNLMAMFNHGNVRLPAPVEAVARWFVVTPDVHRVHHSAILREAHSNFGFNLVWWDRLFGTFVAQPAAGHADMVIGLGDRQDATNQDLLWMLAEPFRTPGDEHAVERVPTLSS